MASKGFILTCFPHQTDHPGNKKLKAIYSLKMVLRKKPLKRGFSCLGENLWIGHLLLLSYNREIKNNIRFNTIWNTVKKAMVNLSSYSKEFAEEIISRLEDFIADNVTAIEDVKYNYDIIEDIKSSLLKDRLKPNSYRIKECISFYEEVF
ncbi:hypothetical protein ACFSKL_21995 [Belliella marina]|uniref:Uncharacterized protein n=1 Tax=Belliella marina TaxID=1644146 RepID=A0ABW4VVY2_9BACT